MNKCFGLNVKTVQEDVFYLSNSISVCFMNDTDWIHNNFINNNGIDLRKDCYLFDDTQEKIRFVGLFEKSENDSLKYSCIANKVDLSKFAKQKEHRNKRLAKKIPMDVLKRKAVEHDHALAKKRRQRRYHYNSRSLCCRIYKKKSTWQMPTLWCRSSIY